MEIKRLVKQVRDIEMPEEMRQRIIRKCLNKNNTRRDLKGFFKDITNWNGAVVGTTYEQASDELQISVVGAADELNVQVTIVNPNMPPYIAFDKLGIGSYKIVDGSGNVVVEGTNTDRVSMTDGQVNVKIPMENVAGGTYKLVVNSFVGAAKADQPLEINGLWECEFTR